MLSDELAEYVEQRIEEFDQIPGVRKEQLEKLARYVSSCRASSSPARLTFICSHNSRRSHMSQLWARTAAAAYGIDEVQTYSGGTEATSFDPRAVAALVRAGFRVDQTSEETNPVYEVSHHPAGPVAQAFSKIYDEHPNPTRNFCAVMTCSQADSSCPTVKGASLRLAIPYEDPKAFDGTEREAAAYDERCLQIGREMLFLFSRVR